LTFLEAAKAVLAEAGEALTAGEIVKRARDRGLIMTGGKTPAQTLYTAMLMAVRKGGEKGVFERVGRGLWRLRTQGTETRADRRYWFLTVNPSLYDIEELLRKGKETWGEKIKGGAARKRIREMKPGDIALVYCTRPMAKVVCEVKVGTVPRAERGHDIFEVELVRGIDPALPLRRLRSCSGLSRMEFLRQPQLSVSRVSASEYATVQELICGRGGGAGEETHDGESSGGIVMRSGEEGQKGAEAERLERLKRIVAVALALVESASEVDTEYKVIGRVLEDVVGWSSEFIKFRHRTKRNTEADIALVGADGSPLVYVECKALKVKLSDADVREAIQNAQAEGGKWAVLTNGLDWWFYHAGALLPDAGRRFLVLDLRQVSEEPEQAMAGLGLLSLRALGSGDLEAFAGRSLYYRQAVQLLSQVEHLRQRLKVGGVPPGGYVREVAEFVRSALPEQFPVTITSPSSPGRLAVGPGVDRHNIRLRFWTELLEKARKRTSLHASRSPSRGNYVSTGAGRSGLSLGYGIREHDGEVELYIDRGQDAGKENEAIFDELVSQRKEVEEAFGEGLEWERLEGKRACRIRKRIPAGGWRDDDLWPKVQDAMVDAMVRLEKALRPHIDKLRL
jgi:predicted RNA-binding protein with PUA-like domain